MSQNLDKYNNAFKTALSLDEAKINKDLKYNDIPEWDSIGHLTLMSELEEAFKISIETDDVIDFSSYVKGKQILEKYKVII